MFQFHVHSEDLDCSWQRHVAYPFTPEQCVVFEVVGYRRTYIDVVIRLLGGRTGAALLTLTGTNTRTGSQWNLTQPSVAG